ncbi:hypothetical protein WYI_03619 [Ochrobactrum sp. CDB2]|nr:hypothetical protein WYI_03619 [Ochrobactrum sp. CDB2]GLU27862.1 hypothetical protein Brsp01_30950 [Brucella sp. NBRC 12950]
MPSLFGEVGGKRDFKEERRIRTQAFHLAAMLALLLILRKVPAEDSGVKAGAFRLKKPDGDQTHN